jgi:hypothetical protein
MIVLFRLFLTFQGRWAAICGGLSDKLTHYGTGIRLLGVGAEVGSLAGQVTAFAEA